MVEQAYQFILLFLLLILSSIFSSSETALLSITKIEIKQLKEKGYNSAYTIEKLLKDPNKVLTTILIGNNLVNIGASALATFLAIHYFQNRGVGIATGLMTLIILVFGEITPKTYASQNAEKVAIKIAKPLEILQIVFFPVINVLNFVSMIIIRIMGGDFNKGMPFVTEEEIKTMVYVGHEEGLLEEEETEMIESIFAFDDTIVEEVMVPRIDMVCLQEDATVEEAINLVMEKGFSRIPVFKETIDNITGIVYAKDLLAFVKKDKTNIEVNKLMREPYFIPETKKVNNLLRELQSEKIHMAIVLDEYGGTAGLVTIEDLLEEIVGDILDEYDKDEELIKVEKDGCVILDSRVGLDEINELLDLSLPEEQFDSIGGFVFDALGHIPEEGERIEFQDFIFEVLRVNNKRITKIKYIPKNEQPPA